MGVWEDRQNFEYALKVGTYKAKNYVQFINAQAEKAMKRLFDTGKLTVIVQDNASIHRANIAKERVEIWSKQGLILFSLPPYSPRHALRGKRASASGHSPCMNRIEDQWLHLKRHELAGRVFEDEYDLAKAIIQGIKHRGQQGNFSVERLMFN